jgi:tetratricopeptide (TPR) repeat protein
MTHLRSGHAPLLLFASLAALVCLPATSRADTIDPAAAQAYGLEIAARLKAGDSAFFDAAFDLDRCVPQALAGLGKPSHYKSMLKGIRGGGSPGVKWVAALKATPGSSVVCLRYRPNPPRLVFRTLHASSASYRELYLAPEGKGLRVTDMKVYRSGRLFLDLIRQSFINVLAGLGKLDGGKSTPQDRAWAKHADELQSIAEALNERRYAEVLKGVLALPAVLRDRHPVVLDMRIRASGQVSLDNYRQAVDALRKAFPDSSALPYLDMAVASAIGDVKLGLASVDQVSAQLGGDPYLDIDRARIYVQAKNFPEARRALERAAKAEPGLGKRALMVQFDVELQAKDWKRLAKLTNTLSERFGVTWSDFTKDPDMLEFTRSAEFPGWLKRQKELRAKRAKPQPSGKDPFQPPAGTNLKAKMGAVDRAQEAGDHATALSLARRLKAELLAKDPCDPLLLGWAHYYEFRALFGLKKWQAALDLLDAKLSKVYLIDAKNRAFMHSVGSECAARLSKPHECLRLMRKCVDLRLANKDPSNALTAVNSGYQLFALCGVPELAPKLVCHLIVRALEQKQTQWTTLALKDALRRQLAKPERTITQCLVQRFGELLAFARTGGREGLPLLRQLYLTRRAAWYQKGLKSHHRVRDKIGYALWLAASRGEVAEIKRLLKAGADPNHLNLAQPEKLTPLLAAAAGGHTKALRVLVKTAKLEERSPEGRSALHLACAAGHYAAARVLVKAGADTGAKDASGKTCLDLAKGHPKIERLLQ